MADSNVKKALENCEDHPAVMGIVCGLDESGVCLITLAIRENGEFNLNDFPSEVTTLDGQVIRIKCEVRPEAVLL